MKTMLPLPLRPDMLIVLNVDKLSWHHLGALYVVKQFECLN